MKTEKNKKKKVYFTIRINESILKKIKQNAEKEKRTPSNYIRFIIDKFLN